MANITYKFIFKFASGEEKSFIDTNHTFSIIENYKSPVLLTPQLFGVDDNRDYYTLLIIDGRVLKNYIEDYKAYKEFGDSIVSQLNIGDPISTIILKDLDSDQDYYYISADQIVGIEAGGASDRGDDNKMVYRLQIYYKKGE